jgi:hypothetical protein
VSRLARGGLGVTMMLLAFAGPARAYVRSTTQANVATAWGHPNLELEIYTGEPPQFVSADNIRQAVLQATNAWSKPQVNCTDVAFRLTEVPEAFAPADFDNRNRIGFRRGTTGDDWKKIPCMVTAKQNCAPYPSGAIAITTVTSNSKTGEILDADMEINAVNQKFAELGDDGNLRPELARVHDLQNTLTHEMGHLLGFDHNCYDEASLRGPPLDNLGRAAPNCRSAPADIRAATMFNQAFEREVSKRSLATDDLLAVCQVYPVGYISPFLGGEDDNGGCSFAAAPRRPGAAFALGLFVLGSLGAFRVARRRRW